MAEYLETNGSMERQNGNSRCLLYKKPISKDNYKLEIDYEESPQETRRQEFLNQQKKLVKSFPFF